MRNGPSLHLAPKPLHLASLSPGAKAKDGGHEGKQQRITSQYCICVCVSGVFFCACELISLQQLSTEVADLSSS